MSADDQKRLAGEAAAALVEDGMTVGLGTGSTAAWFVKGLAARKLDIRGVPTSEATSELARSLGIKLASLDETKVIDLTVDGADEIGPGLSLIKGGGAALLREKLVWEASRRCVTIADAAKVVQSLGKFHLPIEVVAFGHAHTQARICDALAEGRQSLILRKGGIAEGPRGFVPEHDTFWLYPTHVHQAEQGLRHATADVDAGDAATVTLRPIARRLPPIAAARSTS